MAKSTGRRIIIDDPSDNVAIRVSNVSKSFRLPHNRQNSIKGSLVNLIGGGDRSYETQEVLKDISFEIKKGEFFGIVGRNGSGKSTLLKMLAGIYKPTAGSITVNGSLTPFIELGVGFNPELTGRENVYMNGALLGFNDREVDAMYDDIVEFAELERFMDQKLKNYSSGMQVRLAFSIAIRARSDILLLDEVLAVGDEAFQRKCFEYFAMLKKSKSTVVLVTHDMGAVQKFCSRALMISDGNLVLIAGPEEVADLYTEENDEAYAAKAKTKSKTEDGKQSEIKLSITNGRGDEVKRFYTNDMVEVDCRWNSILGKYVGIALIDSLGRDVFSPNTFSAKVGPSKRQRAGYKVRANLQPGEYHFKAALFGDDDTQLLSRLREGPKIIIENKPGSRATYVGITELDHEWQV